MLRWSLTSSGTRSLEAARAMCTIGLSPMQRSDRQPEQGYRSHPFFGSAVHPEVGS